MVLRGVGIGGGAAVGPVLRMADPLPDPPDLPRTAPASEHRAAAASALAGVAADLRALAAGSEAEGAAVLAATAEMAADPELLAAVIGRIEAGATAERAVFDALAAYRELFAATGGATAERADDLADLSRRVVARLRGVEPPAVPRSATPFVLVARDLAPVDTATLDLGTVLAIVTEGGGATGHTAILARSKGIPAVVGCAGAASLADGTDVLVDAAAGTVIPGGALLERSASAASSSGPCTLADGFPLPLLANLGSLDEADAAIAVGAEGVGLFRTEFLFPGSAVAPTVARQRDAYRRLLDAFPGLPVVVRVLDAGSDKPLPFLGSRHEPNPALGLRGLRALRAAEPVLLDQLAALAAEAGDADLRVMAPMVSTLEEAEYFTGLCRDAGLPSVGVMIEVPALALAADSVLSVVDFASVGTNDLAQYVMAADRTDAALGSLLDPWQPAVLRLVAMAGEAAARLGLPLGVCGEAASDPSLAVVLVGLGATSLSMAPAAIPAVREALARVGLDEARSVAAAALAATSPTGARQAAR